MTENLHEKGIDYGKGTNTNKDESGIRYGVIPQHEVLQTWVDESEAEYLPFCPECFNELDRSSEYGENAEIGQEYFCSHCDKGFDDTEDILPDTPIGYYYNQDGYNIIQNHDDADLFITKSPYFTYAENCSPCAPGAGYITSTVKPEPDQKTYCLGHDWFEEKPTGKWTPCKHCEGTGIRLKKDIPNFNLDTFIENGGKVFDDNRVYCWVCFENFEFGYAGYVKEYVKIAPYPVYSVETGELVEPIVE